jgi:hypothetical protein
MSVKNMKFDVDAINPKKYANNHNRLQVVLSTPYTAESAATLLEFFAERVTVSMELDEKQQEFDMDESAEDFIDETDPFKE